MWNRKIGYLASLTLFAGSWIALSTFAGGDQEDIEIRVHKKIAIECDDSDSDCGRRVLIIGDDGKAKKLQVTGDKITWFGDHGVHNRILRHLGSGPFLGVQLTELTPELRSHFGVSGDAGVMVSKVVDDSPASRAGVQVGDIITAVGGDAVRSGHGLAQAIRSREAGDIVDLEIWRDGQIEILSPAVEEREGRAAKAFKIHCGDDEDCDLDLDFDFDFDFDFHRAFDCGDSDDCRIEVDCDDGDCKCLINGEEAECSALHGRHYDD